MRVLTVALCAVALVCGVSALQWQSAFSDGQLFYPGVGITFNFVPKSDLRFDARGLNGQGGFYVEIGAYQSGVYPNGNNTGITDYVDGVLPAGTVEIYLYAAANPSKPAANLTYTFQPYRYYTALLTGNLLLRQSAVISIVEYTLPRYYTAQFWTGTQLGSFSVDSFTYPTPHTGDSAVEVYIEIPTQQNLAKYQEFRPVYVNFTVSDDTYNDNPDAAGYGGAGGLPKFNTPYFKLAPFVRSLVITNNQGYMASGSVIKFTGAALDVDSSYHCQFNNTRANTVAYSAVTNPTDSATYSCTFPDSLSDVSMAGDQIQLLNISVVTAVGENYGWIPVALPPGYGVVTWTFQELGGGGGSGLTGGQIFAIVFCTFLGVGALVYVGFRVYKQQKEAGWGGYTETTDGSAAAASNVGTNNQIQYNAGGVTSSGYQGDNI